MKNVYRTTLATVAALAAALSKLGAQEIWTPEGFESTSIYSLASGPSGTSYAGTYEGIFRSTEPGVWSLLPGSPVSANVIVADPSDPDTLFTGSYLSRQPGLYKSTNGGDLFDRLSLPVGVRSIAIDPANAANVYVGGDYPEVLRSTDGGTTFTTPVSDDLVAQIAALVVDPTRPGTVYAGSDLGFTYSFYYFYPPVAPVMRSTDAGVNWAASIEQAEDDPDAVLTLALAADPTTGALYAATYDNSGGASVFRSFDGGLTWDRSHVLDLGSISALVVDPRRVNTLYAATTEAGVLRSVDAGSSWEELNVGLPIRFVNSLALDTVNDILRVTDGQTVFSLKLAAPPFSCSPGTNRLCLLGGRYQVVVNAFHPRFGTIGLGAAIPGGDRYGAFSLPSFTGDPTLPEVFVKMIDTAPGPPVWIAYGGLTSLSYELSVIDTITGAVESYRNQPENRFCGGVDGSAFFETVGESCAGCWDYVRSAGAESESLSLLVGRFSITLSAFSSRHGRSEQGVAVAKTGRYGYFSLPGFTGDATFPEVYVKMVDFRAITGDFVLFHTGLTSLDYTLTVTDEVTGAVRTIESPGDFCGGVEVIPGTN